MKLFDKLGTYWKDSYTELVHKVTWPSRSELTNSAVVVMIASVIIASAIFIVDSAFEFVMNQIYRIL